MPHSRETSNLFDTIPESFFNRVRGNDVFPVFLSGYHNTAKQKLLKMIYEQSELLGN